MGGKFSSPPLWLDRRRFVRAAEAASSQSQHTRPEEEEAESTAHLFQHYILLSSYTHLMRGGGSSPFDNGMREGGFSEKGLPPFRRGRESNCVSAPLFRDGQTAKGTLLLLFLRPSPLFCDDDDDNQASRL